MAGDRFPKSESERSERSSCPLPPAVLFSSSPLHQCPRRVPPYFMRVSDIDAGVASSSLIAAATSSPMKNEWLPQSTVWDTEHSIQAIESTKIGAPVVPSVIGQPFSVMSTFDAGFENFTNGRVFDASQRFTVKDPPPTISR